jgi:toxin ParE1/3/4
MTGRAKYSHRSRLDLISILEYVGRDNAPAAERLIARLEERCNLLAQFPDLGTRVRQFGENARLFSSGSYVIYYHAIEGGIEVARVLHGARDPTGLV